MWAIFVGQLNLDDYLTKISLEFLSSYPLTKFKSSGELFLISKAPSIIINFLLYRLGEKSNTSPLCHLNSDAWIVLRRKIIVCLVVFLARVQS